MENHKKGGKHKKSFKRYNKNKYPVDSVPSRPKKKSLSDNWSSYIPDKFDKNDLLSQKLSVAKKYLESFNDSSILVASSKRYFLVEVDEILSDTQFTTDWPSFMYDLENTPELVIGLFGLAMNHIITGKDFELSADIVVQINGISYKVHKKIIPHFVGLRKIISFYDLKTHNYEKFVSLVGMVVRTTDVKPFCLDMAFECRRCKSVQVITQVKGCYTTPNRCTASECHSAAFQPLLNSPLTQTVSWKTMRLQELNTDLEEGGRVPMSIECELYNDLTDLGIPGDVVTVSGILTLINANERKTTLGRDAGMHIIGLEVNSMTFLKGSVEGNDLLPDAVRLPKDDLNIIQKVHSHSNLFELIISSLAPNIYGHELVKAGIILALFGGGTREDAADTFSIRENSHILIVGDPGLGKSQLLLASSSLSPRGVYVCGNSTTSSGLTVTVSGGGADHCLEAGALVLADRGHCCIDEFDKMPRQHAALLEVMEQQTVSVAKSGAVCALPGRTSVLAAANPAGGHYDRSRTASENLRISDAILSRFDVVFVLRDSPDQGFDQRMTDHVMGIHGAASESWSERYTADMTFDAGSRRLEQDGLGPPPVFDDPYLGDPAAAWPATSLEPCDLSSQNPEAASLLDRLRRYRGQPLPHVTLRKYISYARTFSYPRLSPDAKAVLRDFFLEARRCWRPPPTARMLEALVRLTRARARVELRSTCTAQDAAQVVEVMRGGSSGECLVVKSLVPTRRAVGSKRLLQMLREAADRKGDDCFMMAEIEQIAGPNAEAAIEALNEKGYLLKKGFQLYKLLV